MSEKILLFSGFNLSCSTSLCDLRYIVMVQLEYIIRLSLVQFQGDHLIDVPTNTRERMISSVMFIVDIIKPIKADKSRDGIPTTTI